MFIYLWGRSSKDQHLSFRNSMGCNVGCPFIGRAFDDNWGLEDPTGQSDAEFKAVIKEIENRIMKLRDELM